MSKGIRNKRNDKFHLRRQISLIYLLVIMSSIFIISLISKSIIKERFDDIAIKSGTDSMRLVINLLNINIERLETSAKDYGVWDDTYDFIYSRSEEYVKSNYVDETFKTNNWDILFILTTDNSVAFSKGYSLDEEEERVISEGLISFIINKNYLFEEEGKESAIVASPEGILMLATHPILRSSGSGPSRGRVVCGRYLNKAVVNRIIKESLVVFTLEDKTFDTEPKDKQIMSLGKHSSGHIWTDGAKYQSYSNIYDNHGKILFSLSHDINKDLIEAGKSAVFQYSASTIGILFTSAVLIFFYINKKVFNRLKGLIDSISNILESSDLSKRVQVSENDEISILENRFNSLISTIEDTQKEIMYQAQHDPLTGTLNRIAFFSRVEEVISKNSLEKESCAMIFIDLDGFKDINDLHGHHIGDYILRNISKRLKAVVNNYGGFVARFGGDEFVVFIPKVDSKQVIVDFSEDLLDCIKLPIEIDNKSCQVTCSAGISLFPDQGLTVDDLINNADIAMYNVKKNNKNSYTFYSEDMRNRVSLEMLQQALENDEFVLYYQKQVDAVSGRTQGVEALVRWKHPQFGLIPPGDFIPLAEETRFIVPLGNWILERACRQCKAWNEGVNGKLRVAVNISSIQFMQREFIKEVTSIIHNTGISPSNLEFEITESVALNKEEEVIDKIRQLKQLGIRIAIDDFGTGYSSLNYLEKFNIDGLKIDKAFIDNIDKNSSVARSIIALAQNLGIAVLAEGVETESQVRCLIELGCSNMQGYYFAKPVPAEQLI